MAKNKSLLKSYVDSIQMGMDKLYGNTFLGNNTNTRDLNDIKGNIDNSIDTIIKSTKDTIGVSNISQLYKRTHSDGKDDNTREMEQEFNEIMNGSNLNSSVIGSFGENANIVSYDEDIDFILKYMPRLKSALQLKKDHVLLADSFSKDFIKTTNNSNIKEQAKYNDRIESLKKIYNLNEFIDTAYDNAARYGEQFIYIKPYRDAFRDLMNDKNSAMQESVILTESVFSNDVETNITVNFMLDESKILQSAIKEHSNLVTVMNEDAKSKGVKFDNLNFEGLNNKVNDGLIDMNTVDKKKKQSTIDIPGCVLKKLKRECVIPRYIESTCLGYYYIECEYDSYMNAANNMMNNNMVSGTSSTHTKNLMNIMNANKSNTTDEVLEKLASDMAKKIDEKFINNNQDLKHEIYLVLKYHKLNDKTNSKVNVTYIPADDMIHMYFDKDEKTNRGVSDLDSALVPAKIHIVMMMTNTIGVLTRSQDKRIYYVKNHIDTNISKTLLNTINQLKKSNYNSREILNTKHFLNMQGQYSDLMIPMGASGDAPINFEVMQGQDIDMKTDFLERLEELAVNSTDIPYEYVSSSDSVDFAMRITMHNGKTLRSILKRQSKLSKILTVMMSKLYNYEFNENDVIEVNLPAPSYLDSVNTGQLVESLTDMADKIVEMEMSDEDDDVAKGILRRKIQRHYLSSYVDADLMNTFKEQSMMEAKLKSDVE